MICEMTLSLHLHAAASFGQHAAKMLKVASMMTEVWQ